MKTPIEVLKEIEEYLEEHKLTAANWNAPDDDYTEIFALQNLRQFWLPEEIALSKDIKSWNVLSDEEKESYKEVLAGLTLLDTMQGDTGMNKIAEHIDSHQKTAVLTFMGGMENLVHARSYSNIFMTVISNSEITALHEWVAENKYLQKKGHIINHYYNNIEGYDMSLYKAMVSSVALESFLFYSGFYYPLYLAGQGKMTAAGEIINLIIRDESIHGVFVGLIAQEMLRDNIVDKEEAEQFVYELFDILLENEIEYTRDVYNGVYNEDGNSIEMDVIEFVKYNANKALNNLGFDSRYEVGEVDAVVLNGLNTDSKTHDFFSVKGNSYKKATVEKIQTSDFYFD